MACTFLKFIYIQHQEWRRKRNRYQNLLKIQELKLSIIEYFKQQLGPMFIHPPRKRPISTPQWAQLPSQPNTPLHPKPTSSHKIKAADLSALKKRVKQRHQNKENNPMFKSENWEHHLFSLSTPIGNCSSTQHPPLKPFGLNIDDFQIGDLLGRGAQARVRLAVHKPTRSIYSLKTIGRQKVEEKMDSFIRALKIQMYVEHPNIAKIYGIIVQERNIHIIMQYCMDGDLSMNVRVLKESKNIKNILFHTAQGLAYLHSLRIHHRDIKLENILLNCGVPKITDFQLSIYTKRDFFPRKTMCGSPAYFCPEMIEKQRYNKKADVWSLGIVFFELLCGFFPFEVNGDSEVQNIEYKNMKGFPVDLDDGARCLILQMLCKESEDRLSIIDVINHPYFEIECPKAEE